MMSADDVIAQADALRDRGFFAEAAIVYRRAVGLAPQRVDLLIQLGNMLKDSGDLSAAVEVYSEAVRRKPSDPDIFLQLGRAFYLAGQRPSALRCYARGLHLEPAHKDLLQELSALGEGWQAGRHGNVGDRLLTSVLHLADDMRNILKVIERELPLINSLVRLPPERHDLWRQTRRAPPPEVPPSFVLAVVMRGQCPAEGYTRCPRKHPFTNISGIFPVDARFGSRQFSGIRTSSSR